MAYDENSPAQSNQALSDIDIIRTNVNAVRELEASLYASPPSNPVAGMLWYATDTDTVYQRNSANSAWVYLWKESDVPAKASDLSSHEALNITSSVTVHGIKQGPGNGLDADTVDGSEAADFAGASHVSATTGIHGVGASTVESVLGSQAKVDVHGALTSNPHSVTAAQAGAVGTGDTDIISLVMLKVGLVAGVFTASEITNDISNAWPAVAGAFVYIPAGATQLELRFTGKAGGSTDPRFRLSTPTANSDTSTDANLTTSYANYTMTVVVSADSGWTLIEVEGYYGGGTVTGYLKNAGFRIS